MARRVTGDWGVRFGRYVLLERIGSGGMADVFRAVALGEEGFQRTFVLKRIRSDRSASSSFIEMFVNEARISSLLDHENIVQTHDFGEVDGCYFITMEYLRGKDLATVLPELRARGQRLDPGVAAFLGLQVARGLAYAHAFTSPTGVPLNIVHRDVTPSNIMLLRSGGIKLLDFGIAKTRGEFTLGETTETGVCKGKLPYLSPEQVEGHSLDRRSDVFALGIVLWESLTGRRLFLGRTDYETMQAVIGLQIPAPSTVRAEVPLALDRIVLRALERDRDTRYPDARSLADDLEGVVQDLGYRSEAVPRLLDDLFGREGNSVSLTPADLPVLELGPSESWPTSPSFNRRELTDPEVESRPTALAGQRPSGRRWAFMAAAAVLGLVSLLLTERWLGKQSEARGPRPAVHLAAKPER